MSLMQAVNDYTDSDLRKLSDLTIESLEAIERLGIRLEEIINNHKDAQPDFLLKEAETIAKKAKEQGTRLKVDISVSPHCCPGRFEWPGMVKLRRRARYFEIRKILEKSQKEYEALELSLRYNGAGFAGRYLIDLINEVLE